MNNNTYSLLKSEKSISNEIGILSHFVELPRYQTDPKIINCGIWACNTKYINGEIYNGRSGGCGYSWENTMLSTIGETLERYACVFYDEKELLFSSYKNLCSKYYRIHPNNYALFHEQQYKRKDFPIRQFDEDVEVSWVKCIDLTVDKEVWIPGQFIYMPFTKDNNFLTVNTSTGLAAHTNFYKAVANAIYECIERDSFMISWMNRIHKGKIFIDADIRNYISLIYPESYRWNFFDISFDLEIPTVFGICYGEAEFGKFVAVGSATRATYKEAIEKVIQEIGQAVPYFRWVIGEKGARLAKENFEELMSFEDHSIFYLNKPELLEDVFGPWINSTETKRVNFKEVNNLTDISAIKRVLQILKNNKINVILKDLTTVDVNQLGYKSLKIFSPQLIQMSGAYPLYFNGSSRLYDVPFKQGFKKLTFEELNKYPHPFP